MKIEKVVVYILWNKVPIEFWQEVLTSNFLGVSIQELLPKLIKAKSVPSATTCVAAMYVMNITHSAIVIQS